MTTDLGGRADIRKSINDVHLTLSLTDATVREFEAAPWLTGALITAEKKLNSAGPPLPAPPPRGAAPVDSGDSRLALQRYSRALDNGCRAALGAEGVGAPCERSQA